MHRSTGPSLLAAFVSLTLGLLFGAGLVAASGRLRTERRLRDTSRLLALVFVATFGLSYAVTRATHSGFVARYTMTLFPLHVLLATCGACSLRSRRLGVVLATVVWAAGLTVAITQIDDPRTRAPVFADALAAAVDPGDVVLYCPDQLGPPLVRLLNQRGVHIPQQWTYPEFRSPDRVDWIDYGDRHRDASPTAFATEAVRRAGSGDVWLVLSVTHPPTEEACAGLWNALRALRPDVEVRVPDRGDWHEHDSLLRFHSAAAGGQG
jgi:hypothetical protein